MLWILASALVNQRVLEIVLRHVMRSVAMSNTYQSRASSNQPHIVHNNIILINFDLFKAFLGNCCTNQRTTTDIAKRHSYCLAARLAAIGPDTA